jgi:hypothetical protein
VLREIQPQEYVALYWLGDGLHILHDFTTDASVLQQVLADYDSKSSRQLDNSDLADPSLNTPNPSTPAGQASERQAFRLAFDQRVANQSTRDRVRATVSAESVCTLVRESQRHRALPRSRLRCDLPEIQMQHKEDRWTATVRSVFLQLDRAGHILQVDDRTFHPDFDTATYETVLRSGISDTRQVHVLPNATQLCIVVRDGASSYIGSIYLPLAQYFPDSSKRSQMKQ